MKQDKNFTTEEEELRQQLNDFLKERGIMQRKISEISGVARPTLSLFINGHKRIMDKTQLDIIREYISR